MGFVHKLISKLCVLAAIIVTYIQAVYLYNFQLDLENLDGTTCLIVCTILTVVVIANFVYQLIMYVKNKDKAEGCLLQNELKMNLVVSGVILALCLTSYAIAWPTNFYWDLVI